MRKSLGTVDRNERNVQEQIRLDQEVRELINEQEENGTETSNCNEDTLPLPAPIVRALSEPSCVIREQIHPVPALVERAPIQPAPVIMEHILPPPVHQPQEDDIPHLPLPAPIVRAPSEPSRVIREQIHPVPALVERAPIQPAPIIMGHILPPPVPQPQEDDIPQMPRWPISLHVPNLLGLDISNLMPWNQLSTRYTAAVNQLRSCAERSQERVFTYLNRLYDSQMVHRSGLPWLLDTAPQPPHVVANVEQNIYSLLVEKDLRSLQGEEWLNDNVINFVLNRLVHFQASCPCTGKFTYLYDTRFYPAYLARDPMIISRISQQTRAPLRPFTESQRRGGGLFYQNENILDPATYKFVFLPRHDGTTHWQFVLLHL
jgi:hypothetical protein